MTTHDITGFADRLEQISVDGYRAGSNKPGMCLRWSYFAVGLKPNLTPASIAMDAWNSAPAEHRHPIGPNTVVPADVPVILGPSSTRKDGNAKAGDVFPARGGIGSAALGSMTDAPGYGAGRIGRATIGARALQTQRPIYGYLTKWLGYEITTTSLAGTSGPPPTEEHDMTAMRLIHNNTVGDKDYGYVALVCVETGFWWHVPNEDYIGPLEQAYGIKKESMPTNWFGFWRQLATGHRTAIQASVWSKAIEGTNAATYLTRIRKLATAIESATNTKLTDAQVSAIAAQIKLPELNITGKAVAA